MEKTRLEELEAIKEFRDADMKKDYIDLSCYERLFRSADIIRYMVVMLGCDKRKNTTIWNLYSAIDYNKDVIIPEHVRINLLNCIYQECLILIDDDDYELVRDNKVLNPKEN